MDANVMDLVNYFEHKQTESGRQRQLMQPRAVRPDSAGRLLAIETSIEATLTPQEHAEMAAQQTTQVPQTPHRQAKYGFPITPQSIHRHGAPGVLKIPQQSSYIAAQPTGPYAPTANAALSNYAFAQIAPAPYSADRASFPDLSSSDLKQSLMQASPRRQGHARQNSAISVASSVASSGSLFLSNGPLEFTESQGAFVLAPRISTPPSSPKKRKSPSKSPSKAKERPNYLDKAIMRDTGVSQGHIDSFIGDPLPSDAQKKYRCLFDGCDHGAARKENIRAHIQTHLDDRPYQCPDCNNTFVRPHDFTRHYTTHVDSRDFKCPDCPQAFNRADALQRHRDRDFCTGIAPPGSPTKVRRALDGMEKKKDASGRRAKKTARRQKATQRQTSEGLNDDFWYTSEGSPEYMSSDAGSPEMVLDNFGSVSAPGCNESTQSNYAPVEPVSFSASIMRRADDFLDQIFAGINDVASPPASTQVFSLSPPQSPQQTQPQQLKPFAASPRKKGRDGEEQQQFEMTPPASRDSMLGFLSTSSVHGAATSESAPSLPDLSSASPSPLAFETVTDFDQLCGTLDLHSVMNGADVAWMDTKFDKADSRHFDFAAFESAPSWSQQQTDVDDFFR